MRDSGNTIVIHSRSTAVVLLFSLGVPVNVIIGFTGHKKVDVFYKHYFAILHVDKKKFADEALSKMFGKVDLSQLVA